MSLEFVLYSQVVNILSFITFIDNFVFVFRILSILYLSLSLPDLFDLIFFMSITFLLLVNYGQYIKYIIYIMLLIIDKIAKDN